MKPPGRTIVQRIRLIGLALAFALAGGAAEAQISDNVVKIGVLTDLSGPAATPTGPGSVAAAEMAVADFGSTVLGKPITVISADHQLKPDVAVSIARLWYDRDQVDLIVDVPVSAVGLAVQGVANEKQKLFITHSTGTADFHGKFCSPYTMQWVFDTHALAVGTAQEVVKRGGNSWFFLTADYAFGYSLEKDASDVIKANGGTVVGAVRHPFRTPDLSSFILQAQASKAKIIGLANAGGDTTNSIKQAAEFGIVRGGQKLAGLLVFLTDIHALGLQTAQGLIFTETFYWDLNDQTRAFSKRFTERDKGIHPTMVHAGVYSAVLHYLKAVEALKGAKDGAKVVAKMKETPTDDPLFGKGMVRVDGRKIHPAYLVEVKKPSESKAPWDYYKVLATIPADQAFRPLSEGGCPLVK